MQSNRLIGGILGAATMFLAADAVRAATLYFDADGSSANGANGAAGALTTWNTNTSKNWYLNSANPDVVWTTPNDAVFGGTAGTVAVSANVNPSTLTIDTSGYVFTTAAVKPQGSGNNVFINGDAEFKAGLQSDGTTTIASGAKLTLTSGTSSLAGVSGGSVSLAGGTLSAGNLVLNSTVTQSGGTVGASASGNHPTIGSGRSASWTLTDNAATFNVEKLSFSTSSSGVTLDIGSGDGGNGTLNINAGTVNVQNGAMLRIGLGATGSSTTTGTVNVAGGNLTVTGSHPLTGNSTVYIVDSGNGVNGTLAVSGGTATIDAIRFGRTATSGQGALNVSNGALYVGSGGIATGTLPTAIATVTLSGGTVGATADWSSSMPISLSAPATIKAADAGGVAHDISLTGNLSGAGGLTKSGAGKLTLASAGYIGATHVTAGTLEVNGTLATSGVAVDNGATLQGTGIITNGVSTDGIVSPAGATIGMLTVGSATFGTGSGLNIDLGAASASDLLSVAGALDISQAVLNVSGVADGSSYVIATYGGTLTGTFTSANLPENYKVDYGTGTNSQISLVVVPEPVLGLLVPGALLALGRRSRRTR